MQQMRKRQRAREPPPPPTQKECRCVAAYSADSLMLMRKRLFGGIYVVAAMKDGEVQYWAATTVPRKEDLARGPR
jgi:hypothetical protein